MKNIYSILSLALVLFVASCGDKSNSDNTDEKSSSQSNAQSNSPSSSQPKASETNEVNEVHEPEVSKEPQWNYSGYLGKYKIKAMINYEESYHNEGSGAIQIPISGYYFYESTKTPIPINGSCNGAGIIYFVAETKGGDEYFDGSFTESQLSDFTGTWSKGSKSLNFSLISNE